MGPAGNTKQGGATRPADSCETGGDRTQDFKPTEDATMTRDTWDRLINSLLCVRLGQELGTSSDIAQAVAGAVETLIRVAAIFSP
jgi:hypothetical protein